MNATILVIEESLDLGRLFEYILRTDGYEVCSYNQFQAAQASVADSQPDLIIFDWSVMNSDGFAWVEAIRKQPESSHIPILLVCSELPPRAMLDLIASIAVSIIEKPFDIFLFRNRVRALLVPHERAAGMRYA